MEQILELKKYYKSDINISLIGSKIYISIDTKVDNFEIDINKTLINDNHIKKILSE